ncbi:MAG TPA: DUF4292 domain-containing protein [Ignavibacteriaceae bacterium]|nr:DUF4292 domain-containing protein [Ignavibacteriaceae bacterium]
MKRTYLYFFISIIFVQLYLFSGCAAPKQIEDEVEILPSERLINKLEANRRKIKSFQGEGTLYVKTEGINNSATFLIKMQKPDSIYLSVMGPFGIELMQTLVTKDNFTFYDALENTAYRGLVSDEILRDIFKIDLSFNDLLDAFIGSVNLTEKLYKQPDDYAIIYDEYRLTYKDSLTNRSVKYNVDVRELGIKEFQLLDENGEPILVGKYSNFNILETVAVPKKIEVTNVKQNQYIQIDYKKMQANKKSIYIDFNIPPDAKIIEW